jgi:midasin
MATGEQASDGMEERKQSLIEMLDQLMHSSTFGEYKTRLDLLQTFYWHQVAEIRLSHENENSPNMEAFKDNANILYHLYHYYAQSLPVVSNALKNLCAPLEKKMKDFILLARWDDLSYFALKTSAEKSHRMLNKFSRKLEEILR